MIEFLQKVFIKENIDTSQGKRKTASLCSMVGIFLNVTLFVVKYLIGLVSGSVSIMADAFNNITDAGTSVAMLFGVKIASYGKGERHPMGHGRFEWIISSLMAFVVMIIGWNLLIDSFKIVGTSNKIETNLAMIILMCLSVVIKFYMYLYNKKYGKIIDSETMKAVSADSISDAIATVAVIISILIYYIFHVNVDGYCGILVSGFIIYNGFTSLFETAGRIIGTAADEDEVKQIRKLILEDGFFKEIYEINIEDFGMGKQRAIIRIGYDEDCSTSKLQDKTQNVYNNLFKKKGLDSLIVTEKITNKDMTEYLRQKLTKIVKEEDPFTYIKLIRITGGDNLKSLYCDIAIPKSKEKNNLCIIKKVNQAVAEEDKNITVYLTFTIFHDVTDKPWINDKNADNYDKFMNNRMFPKYFEASLQKHHEILKDMLNEVTQKNVLDVACGSCDCINYLSKQNNYTGVDLSKSFEKIATKKLENNKFITSKFIVGNACSMKLPSHIYDVVLCNVAMQMITPSASLINEILRVLKKGGLFIGSVPVNDYGKLRFSYNKDISSSVKLKEFLEQFGFKVEIKEKVNGAICYFKAYMV